MKKICIALFLFSFASAASAQTAIKQRNVTPSSFENTLVNGILNFTKVLKPSGDGKEFVAFYYVRKASDAGFNNRKPVQVSLSQQSFDSVFTKTTADLATRWPALNKYIEANKISLTTEGGWVAAITHFNGMQ